jgi:hypothetical protein
MRKQRKLQRPLLVLSNMLLIFPFLLHSYYGIFSRYLADDFCTAAYYKSLGFIASMRYWRLTWSGRYSFYFFINILHFIGQWITPYLTAIVIVIWLFALYFLMRHLLQVIGVSNTFLVTLLLASIVLFSTLNGTPDIYQSLYWQTGLVTYTAPLLFLTVYGVLLVNKISNGTPTSWKGMALSAGITFVAGGFSETYVTLQIVFLLALLMMIFLFLRGESRRSGLLFLGAGLVGAMIALILVVTAPGNTERMKYLPERLDILEVVYLSLRHTYTFAKISLYDNQISSLIALLVPALLALYLPFRENRHESTMTVKGQKLILYLISIPLMAYLLITGTMVPSLYATTEYPVGRALITPQFILIFAFITWSFLLGVFLRFYLWRVSIHSPLILVIMVLLLMQGSYISSQAILNRLPEAQTFASLWDTRDHNIRREVALGAQEMHAASLPHISPGLAELSNDPNDWVNRCLAVTYGLSQVIGK